MKGEISTEERAKQHCNEGNRLSREGRWREAVNEYLAATELDPESEAKTKLEMLQDVFQFYNRDAYNP